MIEEGYKDLSELVAKEKYKELKSLEDQSMIVIDYLCLIAVRLMTRNKTQDKAQYRRSEALLSKLLSEECSFDLPEEIVRVVKLSETQKIELEMREEQPGQEKYRENLFSKEDFLLYRGIARFYLDEYEAAIKDFESSAVAKKEANNQLGGEGRAEQSENMYNSIDTDLSDIGLCAVNVNEQHFNIILCFILVALSKP
eukprot:TRINITY_DN4875_c0_g1_i2.p4 TRINITY_DN4875_c0_g1~~TRINITY_DN4875_c0_g1_i2.p4  ORF type:complete len:198 (-),score=81.89 TRINITY_DN4875_c0_g1_i2:808-1401(-)